MVHEEYQELLSAHALASLDEQAELALNEHLADCKSCRNELDRWNEAAAAVALTAIPMEPSPQVRNRILSQIQAERSASDLDLKEAVQEKQTTRSAHVLPFKPPPKNVWNSIGSLGAIAASVVFVALLASLIILWQQNRAAKAEIARLAAETSSLKAQVENAQRLQQLISTPGVKMAGLSGTNMAPQASAMIAYDKNGHAMLMAKGLPAAPDGKAYQLWYIVGNKKMPGKVFTPDDAGSGSLQDQMPGQAHDGAIFAITLEPRQGTEQPTGPIYLVSAAG